jgi:NodT family efflux transporter outer membrane factor (OMF) lipoprotein
MKGKVSASFFAKKEAKKLLFAGGGGTAIAKARSEQKFFASFFQKRSAFLTFFALTGCMVGPNYARPPVQSPPAYKEAPGWTQARPMDGVPKGAWWTIYGDPQLDALEKLVSVNNQTVAADYFAYEQSLDIVKEEQGALFPTISLTGSATRDSSAGGGAQTTTGTTGTSSGFSSGPRTSGSFEGALDWSPDLWGKIRRQIESDKAAAQVSAADLANATLSAQAALATDYVDLRAADADIQLLQQTVAAYQQSLQITVNQFNAGVAAQSDVITARTTLDGAQAQLVNAGEARAQYEHAIAVLTGHAPADLALAPGTLMTNVPEVPAGLPSTLLERRPDIAAAERAMAEENALIGVAVGAYYPDLSLSALGGFSADPIGGLFSASNELWSLGATASQTLYEGGTRTAAVQAAGFAYQQSLATYRQTVLTAFQQVEDGLSDLRILGQQAQIEQRAVADASEAVQIALNEYQAGTQAYTTVVTAQATLLGDQQAALTVQQNRLVASIALVQALGGGWQTNDLPND